MKQIYVEKNQVNKNHLISLKSVLNGGRYRV